MELISKIGEIIDQSPYKREYIRQCLNVSRNTISNWCTGKTYPTAKDLFKLARLLDCKVDDLYFEEDEE